MYALQDSRAKELGAIAFYDDIVTRSSPWYPERYSTNWLFARHYFNSQGGEVAYFIPDLLPFHETSHLETFETPRKWLCIPFLQPLR